MKFKNIFRVGITLIVLFLAVFELFKTESFVSLLTLTKRSNVETNISLNDIPAYSDTPYVEINQNIPQFSQEELSAETYETYAPLDYLGRVGTAQAMLGEDLMPEEKRGSISEIKPTGWNQNQYDFIQGKMLYNRCHLIAYQLTAEGKNENNLMTGTRYLNTEGMLPFESQIADYIRETGNHVLYRVTPIFDGDNLLASGVQLEAQSIEDNTIFFNVYCYNVQPGVIIDYTTGENRADLNEN